MSTQNSTAYMQKMLSSESAPTSGKKSNASTQQVARKTTQTTEEYKKIVQDHLNTLRERLATCPEKGLLATDYQYALTIVNRASLELSKSTANRVTLMPHDQAIKNAIHELDEQLSTTARTSSMNA
jgi:hypothetical protein